MSYVIVTADFPGVTSEQRDKIYKNLEQEKWIKVKEFGRDISTVWYARFQDNVAEESAIRISINDFVNCSKSSCNPKMVLHWGPSKPSFYGLS